jgi:DNA-binding transcriptional regulator of glucitol operon
VFRSLLTPRWLLLHAVFVLATVATGFLAVWQWDRAHEAGGSFQNLGYALQWPLFGAFTIFLWIRLMRMDVHRGRDEAEQEPAAASTPDEPVGAQVVEETTPVARRKRPLVPPPAPPVDAEDDPELAAYNQYLAELNEADRRAS